MKKTRYVDRHGREIKEGQMLLAAITINHSSFPHRGTMNYMVRKKGGELIMDGVYGWGPIEGRDPQEMEVVTPKTNLRESECYFMSTFGDKSRDIKMDLHCKNFNMMVMPWFLRFAARYFERDPKMVNDVSACINEFMGEEFTEELQGPIESTLKYVREELKNIQKNCRVDMHSTTGRHKKTMVLVDWYEFDKIIERLE